MAPLLHRFRPSPAATLTSLLALGLLVACSAASTSDSEPNRPSGGSGGAPASTPQLGTGGLLSSGSTATEPCNGLDDDMNGIIDDGCTCTPGSTQSCFPFTAALDGVGQCARGTQKCEPAGEFGEWGPCEGATGPTAEVCGDGIDQDCDGGDQSCADGGAGGAAGGGTGGAGGASGCVPKPEICGNGIDEDCDGQDPPCSVQCQNINLFGDCLTVSCPPSAPYPKSCQVFFTPGDDRGCVASTPLDSSVYFQAGDQCNAGFVTGSLCCATTPQPPLDETSCPINKPIQYHPSDKSGCPVTH